MSVKSMRGACDLLSLIQHTEPRSNHRVQVSNTWRARQRRRVIGECGCVIERIFLTEQSNPWTSDVGVNLSRGLKR